METEEPPKEVTKLEGIPLWLFIFFSALSLIGIIYTTIILVFNITKAKTKVVKMTSPNINVVILLAVIVGYGSIVIGGLDTGLVSASTMEKLQRVLTFVIPICFTIIYGALFAKAWRVFLVFKNLNFNGKLTRDEHLLVGVLVMIILDLAILLPWLFVDPVQCHRSVIKTKDTSDSAITYEIDECRSDLQEVWISLLYAYKLVLIVAGLYFTWQTRHVTLPSLRDARQTYVVVLCLVACAFIALPSLLVDKVGMTIRFATGSFVVWIVLTVTLTLLFMPKMLLERKSRETSENASAFNFLFSESMRKTQDAIRKCSLCFCCPATEADKYGQEMLANEIDTLKQTIKQKDTTIRELNDRLYIGAEKFQEYLTSPMKQARSTLQAMQDKHMNRTRANEGIRKTLWSNRDVVQRDVVQITELPRKGGDVMSKEDDEGIHSGDSYQQNSAEQSPNSYHSPNIYRHNRIHNGLPSDAIHTVSNGNIAGEPYDASLTGRSYTTSRRSSYSSVRSVPSFKDQYNGQPWRPPSPDELTPRQISHDHIQQPSQQYDTNQPHVMHNQRSYGEFERQSYREPTTNQKYEPPVAPHANARENVYRHSGRSLPGRRLYSEPEYQNHVDNNSHQPFAQIDLGAMEKDAIFVHVSRLPPGGDEIKQHPVQSGTGSEMPRGDYTYPKKSVSNSLHMMSSQI